MTAQRSRTGAERVRRRAGDPGGVVVLDDEESRVRREDAAQLAGAVTVERRARRVLRPRRHDKGVDAALERADERVRPCARSIECDRLGLETEGGEQVGGAASRSRRELRRR